MSGLSRSVAHHNGWWTTPAARCWARGLLFIIIFWGMLLRVHQLDHDSLWLDEIITQLRAQQGLRDMLLVTAQYDVHPPLTYLVAYQARILGWSEFAVRVPSLFAGTLSIALVFILGRRLWDVPGGLLAAALLAGAPAHLHYSQEARQYALLVFFAAASMYWFYRALQTREAKGWLGYAIATAGGLYTHYFALLWIAAQIVFFVMAIIVAQVRSRASGRSTIALKQVLLFGTALLACTAAYAPWYSSLLHQATQLIGGVASPGNGVRAAFGYSVILEELWETVTESQPVLGNVLMGLMAAGILHMLVRRQWSVLGYLMLSIAIPIAILGTISPRHFFDGRYLLPILVPILLVAAQGLALFYYLAVVVSGKLRQPVVALVSCLIVVIVLLTFDRPYFELQKDDWRSIGRFLEQNLQPDDMVVLLNVADYIGYYSPKATDQVFPAMSPTELDEAYASSKPMWVLVTPYLEQVPTAGEIHNWVQGRPHLDFDFGLTMHLYYLRAGQEETALWHTARTFQLPDRPELWAAKGRAARSLGEKADAFAAFKRASELEDNPEKQADYLFDAADMAYLQGEYADAVACYDRVLALAPDRSAAYLNKAGALLGMRQPAQALENVEIVLSRFRRDEYWPHRFACEALAELERPSEALLHCQRALELSPEAHDLRFYTGLLFARLGNMDQSRLWMVDYLAHEPQGPQAEAARQYLVGPTNR